MCAAVAPGVSEKKGTKTIQLGDVVIWNLGKASDSPAKAKDRNEAIALISDNNLYSAVILACELPSGKVGELVAGEKSPAIKKRGKREAAIIPHGPMKELIQSLDAGDLQTVFDSCKSKLKSSNFSYARFEVCVFRGKILMAAYHGKYKTPDKVDLLDDAVVFIEQIRQDKNCDAVIIGGDFNIKAGIAEKCSRLIEVSGGVFKGKDCARDDPIDFIMCWPMSAFKQKSDPKVIPVGTVIDAMGKEGKIFDHPIFVFDLEFKKPATKPATRVPELEDGFAALRM